MPAVVELESIVTLVLTTEQHEFLRQVLDNPQLSVPVKFARVAGEVHLIVTTAKPTPGYAPAQPAAQ